MEQILKAKEAFKYGKKEDDDAAAGMPLQHLDKVQVLQEAKALFKQTPINAKKCAFMITKIEALLGRGEILTPDEASEIFFSCTSLFISKDEKLKRMIYIVLKSLCHNVEQSFMAFNNLFQDMNSKGNLRPYAMRALLETASMYAQLDRHLKTAIVDQDSSVSSAALVSALQISSTNPDMVNRWANEIQTVMKSSSSSMIQYHALAVLYKLRQQDALAISKLISQNYQSLRSPFAHTLLIRYSARVLHEENNPEGQRSAEILKYLDNCLVYKSEMITLEAAKVLCSLEYLTPKQLTPPLTALQSLLSSPRSVYKFAAIKILNTLASRVPILVSLCNPDIEQIIADSSSSKNLQTLAVTTLLKTGNEVNIDRLMKQINTYMSESQDEFKIVIAEAVKTLCLKFPQKYHTMLTFLNSSLRNDGGFEFKRAVVNSIIQILEKVPQAKEQGLSFLCEYIEDCEFTLLLQQVLDYIGEQGPKSEKPSKCIRYVYNRVLLESAPVRAAAIVTLAKFAAAVPSLKSSIEVILRRALQDNDDEVRDRAVFYLGLLEKADDNLRDSFIGAGASEHQLGMSNPAILEKALQKYMSQGNFERQFSIDMVLEQEKEEQKASALASAKDAKKLAPVSTLSVSTTGPAVTTPTSGVDSVSSPADAIINMKANAEKLLKKIPKLNALGRPFKTTDPVSLTAKDAAYSVQCMKHIYKNNIVLQYICTNNVENHILENVTVHVDTGSLPDVEYEYSLQSSALGYNATDSVFVVLKKDKAVVLGEVSNEMQFTVKTVDADGEVEDEEEEEFELDNLAFTIGNYIRNFEVSFNEEWQKLGDGKELLNSTEIANKSDLAAGIKKLCTILGLSPMNAPEPGKKNVILYFACETINGETALIAAQLAEQNGNVLLKTAIRSEKETTRTRLTAALK